MVFFCLCFSVQHNGGFLPEIILLTLCDYVVEPFEYSSSTM